MQYDRLIIEELVTAVILLLGYNDTVIVYLSGMLLPAYAAQFSNNLQLPGTYLQQ